MVVPAGRLTGQYPLLRQAADRAETGSDGWCAAQYWLARTAHASGDMPATLSYCTALRDAAAVRGPCRALADGLYRRGGVLINMGQYAEAAERTAPRSDPGDRVPAGEAAALMSLGYAALYAGDHDNAVQLTRLAAQITAGAPGVIARWCGYSLTDVLIGAGDLAAAGPVCAAVAAGKGGTRPLPGPAQLGEAAGEGRGRRPVPSTREIIMFTHRPRRGSHPRTATWQAAGACAGSPRPWPRSPAP